MVCAEGSSSQHAGVDASAPKPQDETKWLLGLQIALKCADLGHLAAERAVHER